MVPGMSMTAYVDAPPATATMASTRKTQTVPNQASEPKCEVYTCWEDRTTRSSICHLNTFAPVTTPKDVAKLRLSEILRRSDGYVPVEGVDYFIRDDSYEDDSTGVAHLYIRQLVNGLEVADANINMNIKDGHVLSYGDSVSLFLYLLSPSSLTQGLVQPVLSRRDS